MVNSAPIGSLGQARDRAQLVDAWAAFLDALGPWDWFATLTFRDDTHPEAAAKRFAVWVCKLNCELYGNRWWKRRRGVRWARALERQRRGVVHFHALLGANRLAELRRLWWMDRWEELAGYARIERPRSHVAVRRYCGKYVVKAGAGEIDLGGPLPTPSDVPELWPAGAPIVAQRGPWAHAGVS